MKVGIRPGVTALPADIFFRVPHCSFAAAGSG